ncbi:single-stranded DNA-binding protein [Dactylosporangium vinaceum]|uniref:Single-stranded DNA-binding protein n=1 Tax=Dactylosporangium vinaceum TaxID=53362 RepID=A0ABV5M6E8_9ACTN|nr:single-stranded DNA-binding protein [Dactylosporangium vinaceum]UAB97830.1 single-stranded DNA-binding protein [Dactylosporangium vinaceum]
MFETKVTIIGNVLNAPECRRLVGTQTLVTTFKVASTSRRYDRNDSNWVDGNSLRLRVNCWRQLAENVARSIQVGDPVIITGRLYSRDWESEDHVRRVSYELDAHAVGHDLSRGRGKFARIRAITGTTAIDDELADLNIADAPTEPVDEINNLPRRQSYDEELGGVVTLVDDGDPFAEDILSALNNEELKTAFETATAMTGDEEPDPDAEEALEALEDDEEQAAAATTARPDEPAGPRGRRRPRPRIPAGV